MTRVLAVAGAVITMAGVAMLLVLAAQRGWFGPGARVGAGAALAAALAWLGVSPPRTPSQASAAASAAPAPTRAPGPNHPRCAASTSSMATPAIVMTAPATASTRVTAPSRRYQATGGARGATRGGERSTARGRPPGVAGAGGRGAGPGGEPRRDRGARGVGGARGEAHGILAVDLGAQAGQAVAHGVHAVHGVGEVGLELEDGGAVAHAPTIGPGRQQAPEHADSSACSGACRRGAGSAVGAGGLGRQGGLDLDALAVAQDGEGDLVAGALLADVADEGVGRLDRAHR